MLIHAADNVATALTDINAGDKAVCSIGGKNVPVLALENIPFGHKISLSDISTGMEVIKYGEIIGKASMEIRKGQHVHVHNLESLRGRGDLEVETE